MHSISRYAPRAQSSRGFSLIELSIVVAILSVVATLGLEAAANFVNRTSTSVSRERLVVVDDATARFFKVYGRLPCPAVRTTSTSTSTYGYESCTIAVLTGTSIGGGLMAGAVPWRTLNIPMTYSLDGFGSKLNYIVTKNLTVAGGTVASSPVLNRFGSFDTDDTCTSAPTCTAAATGLTCPGPATASSCVGLGGIEVRTGVLEQPCTTSKCQILANPTYSFAGPANLTSNGAAYFIFSSGADQRGAYSARGTTLVSCATYNPESRVDVQNCTYGAATVPAMSVTTIPKNVFYDNRYNPGLNLTSYYDDVAIWRTKAQL